MTGELLFVPDYRFSPAACERVPAIRTALDEFRRRYSVRVFRWPPSELPERTGRLQSVVAAMERELPDGGHLVTTSGNALFGLLAARTRGNIATFSCDGMCVPAATLRAMGMDKLAESALACIRIDIIRSQGLLALLEDSGEEEARRMIELMCADTDWLFIEELMADYSDVDLVSERPSLQLPSLYLEPATHFAGWVEMSEAFLRFVPRAEVRRLKLWPGRMQDPEAGRELAGHVCSFIAQSAAEPAAP